MGRSAGPARAGWALTSGALAGAVALVAVLVFEPSAGERTDCVELVTSSSTEKGDLIAGLAAEYNRARRTFDGGRCAKIRAYKKTSGATLELLSGASGWSDTEEGQPQPHVWMPSSSLWLGLLQQRDKGNLVAAGAGTSLTASPMVIAMPKVMAEALGWPEKELGWQDLNLNSRGGWAATGPQNAHWGQFTLGKDNPRRSTSGLAATIATYHAATKGDYSKIGDAGAVEFVRSVEASVAYYIDDSVRFLKTLYEEDPKKETPYISAMVLQEEMVYAYNHGAPTGDPGKLQRDPVGLKRPLVAITPKEGTVMIDHPFLTLSSASPEQRAAAADFYDFVIAPEQQNRFRELGFRARDGLADERLVAGVNGLSAQPPRQIPLPNAADIERMLQGWDFTQRRGRILLVLDVSGSMLEPFVKNRFDKPYSEPRINLLKPAVASQLRLLHPDDEVGLWTFAGDGPQPLVPIGKVRDVRDRVTDIVANLQPKGETALFQAVSAAHTEMQSRFDPQLINAIVLLSDGKDTAGGVTREQLLQKVDASRLDNTVRIFTIAYSQDADAGLLAEIAEKSKARSYDASDPVNVDRMFVNAFSNF